MSTFSLASSYTINAERHSGRVLLHESNIVLTFQQPRLSLFPLLRHVGCAVSPLMCFDRIWKMPIDLGKPTGTYGDKLYLPHSPLSHRCRTLSVKGGGRVLLAGDSEVLWP